MSRQPTVLEFVNTVHIEMAKTAGMPFGQIADQEQRKLPRWSLKILEKFRQTILKPVLKLRPRGEINWQDYGKMIGVLKRGKTFFLVDLARLIQTEGFDKITDEQWEKIQPKEQLRAYVVKVLDRPVSESEALDSLVDEVIAQRVKSLEKHEEIAFMNVSQQSAKIQALFLKGLEQGYRLFLDADGNFCGDRGRTEIYMELLSSQNQIEKMRRTLPSSTDEEL